MRILRLCSYYDPEKISSSHLSKDLEEAYVDNGFEVIIYAPTPTRGVSKETRDKYKKIKYEEKNNGRIKIHRFFMFQEGKNPLLRAIRYVLINIIHYFKAIKRKDIDVILVGSTPPTQGILAILVKKKLKAPIVYSLQDMFPDSLVHTGLTTENSMLFKIGRGIERYTYKKVDKIRVISQDFKNNLIDKGIPEDKIKVIHNWIDSDEVKPISRENNILFDKFDLSRESFYVVYAGNLGYAQNIEVILRSAKKLSSYKDIVFIIFGKGSQEKHYKDIAKTMELNNTRFFPLQPYDLVSEVYSLGNVSIISCKKGIGKNAFPSKTWSILSAGTPVIASYDEDTDLQKLITDNNFGLFTKPDDVDGLKEAILDLYKNRNGCETMGQKGREYVVTHMDKPIKIKEYIDTIIETVGEYKC